MERVTKESNVLVEIDLDGTGRTEVATGVAFFDHMLDALGKHGSFDLVVRASGRGSEMPCAPVRVSLAIRRLRQSKVDGPALFRRS